MPRAVWVKRLASAVVFIPVFVWLVMGAPVWAFGLLVVAVSGVASWELARVFKRAGRPVYTWLGVGASAGVAASFLVPGGPVMALALAVVAILSAPLWGSAAPSSDPAAVTLLGPTYVGWLLGHAVLLRGLADGPALVLFLVGVTWTGESAAYVVGSAVGRHKLAPVISPRKTVEGGAAQIVVSGGVAVLLAAWLLPAWPAGRMFLLGLFLGVVGQVGDLTESVIKRSVGAKDTGGLIPGHGGVLDRLDSLLFNVPAFFYCVTLLGSGA